MFEERSKISEPASVAAAPAGGVQVTSGIRNEPCVVDQRWEDGS
jgi:hypothetical protein